MKKQVIAKVKLNPGQGGYFDPITRIHLTHGDPEREIYAGMNTEGLKAAVRNKRISLISGSLGEFIPPFKLVKQPDGKVVLVTNNQKKIIQKKNDKKIDKESVKQETVKDITVDIKDEPVKEQKFEEPVSEIYQEESVEMSKTDEILQTDINNEESVSDNVETKPVNPFKKNRKKDKKKETEEKQD